MQAPSLTSNPRAELSSFDAALVPYPPAAFALPAPKQAWSDSEYKLRLLYLLALQDDLFPPIQPDKWVGSAQR